MRDAWVWICLGWMIVAGTMYLNYEATIKINNERIGQLWLINADLSKKLMNACP